MTTNTAISYEEFEKLSATSGRAIEYWDGEVIEKAVPTWLHGALQLLIAEVLRQAGYKTSLEVDLRLTKRFEPRPDIVAALHRPASRYPTKPEEVQIVVEILSPEDGWAMVVEKCEKYADLGVEQIHVADPEKETAWTWNHTRKQLDRVKSWTLPNAHTITMSDVWRELSQR
jgi:Uma2 family endonuclease